SPELVGEWLFVCVYAIAHDRSVRENLGQLIGEGRSVLLFVAVGVLIRHQEGHVGVFGAARVSTCFAFAAGAAAGEQQGGRRGGGDHVFHSFGAHRRTSLPVTEGRAFAASSVGSRTWSGVDMLSRAGTSVQHNPSHNSFSL